MKMFFFFLVCFGRLHGRELHSYAGASADMLQSHNPTESHLFSRQPWQIPTLSDVLVKTMPTDGLHREREEKWNKEKDRDII